MGRLVGACRELVRINLLIQLLTIPKGLTYLASQDKTAGLKTSALDKNTSDDEIRPFLAEYFISEKHS